MSQVLKFLVIAAAAGCCITAAFAVPKHVREFDYVLDKTPDLARGEGLYETCAACHGAKGEGQGDWLVPRLAGQHSEYLFRQMQEIQEGTRPNMSREQMERLARLDKDTLDSIARYAASLTQ